MEYTWSDMYDMDYDIMCNIIVQILPMISNVFYELWYHKLSYDIIVFYSPYDIIAMIWNMMS